MKLHTAEEILSPCINRTKLTQYAENKLKQLPSIAENMQCLIGEKFSEECIFVNDEGDGLYREYSNLDSLALEVAVNGQGDSWLINTKDAGVHLFDHGTGGIYSLNIDFRQFVQLVDLMKQHEKEPDKALIKLMKEIDSELPENWPFELD